MCVINKIAGSDRKIRIICTIKLQMPIYFVNYCIGLERKVSLFLYLVNIGKEDYFRYDENTANDHSLRFNDVI